MRPLRHDLSQSLAAKQTVATSASGFCALDMMQLCPSAEAPRRKWVLFLCCRSEASAVRHASHVLDECSNAYSGFGRCRGTAPAVLGHVPAIVLGPANLAGNLDLVLI